MATKDDLLLNRVRAKDAGALAEFLEGKRPRLIAYIERNLGNALRRKVEAEDVFQEVSVHAIKALESVELADRDPFRWLCELAERRIVDAHRRFFGAQKRDAAREVALGSPGAVTGEAGLINMLVASMTTPSQAFSRDQKELRMRQAIAELPNDAQEALRLRYVENLSTKEVARHLGKTDVATRVTLSRAVTRLREVLDD
jgi:RNA polymerase sigma-70 factor (ECF subfamily)